MKAVHGSDQSRHRHCQYEDKVRGIIMAGGFPDKVKYARLGLLKSDHESFLKFKFHPLVDKAF